MKRMNRAGLAGLMALFLTGLVSCMPQVRQPEVSVAGVRLASMGLTGGVVDVRLSVYNPNRFALRASGLTYDLDVEAPGEGGWIDLTEGRFQERLEVPSGDSAVVTIPVEFDYLNLGRTLRGLLERGTFNYRVTGAVALEGPVQRDFSYRHSGVVTPSGVR